MASARTLIAVVLAAALGAVPGSANAQPADGGGGDGDEDARRARARELAREGAELFFEGNRRAAVARFEEAYALFPSPVLLYNLGKAHAGLSADERAHRLLTRFLREAAPDEVSPERRREVEELLADLEQRVGVVTIATPRFAGATIEVDGTAVGTAPLRDPVAVAPGVHEIAARRGAVLVARTRITAAAGARAAVALERIEDDLEKVFVTREVEASPVYKRWWFWTAVGAAAASTAAMVIVTNPRRVNEVADPPLGHWTLGGFDEGR
jgi:hypothetical protein